MRLRLWLHRDWMMTALLVVVLASAGCMRSPEAKSAAYIAAGKKLLENKDPARAILQFRNATQATPKNAEAYFQLGNAFLAVGDLRGGVVSLRKALELSPKHTAAQLRLAELMINADDPAVVQDARRRLQALLQDAPENTDALHALALTELRLGEPKDAVQHLERAMAAAPTELVIAVSLAQARLLQKDVKGAEDVLKKSCENLPKSADARVMLGELYASLDRAADAEQQYQQALALDANNGAALLNLATLQRSLGRKQEAEQTFRRLSTSPDKTLKSMYASFLFEEGRRDQAVKEFENLARQDPSDRMARTRLVAAYQAVNRVPDAQKILSGALAKNPRDSDALLQRGELFLGDGKYAQAESDLNQVLHLNADSPEVHYAIAKLHQVRGATLRQRQELNEALRLGPFLLQARLDLAKSLIGDNAADSAKAALSLLDATPESQKNLVVVAEQRIWALLRAGRLDEARRGVDQGLAGARTQDLLLQDSILKIAGKHYVEARQPLHEALSKNPEDTRALRILVGSYAAQNQTHAGVEEVRVFAMQHPKSAEVQYFWGNLLLETGDRVQAKQAFVAAKAADPNYSPTDLSLAQIDLLQANWTDARKQLSGILSTKGESALARKWLGMLEVSVGDSAAAITDFRKVIESQPNDATALNHLAYLLAESGNQPDEALKYAQRAKELDPKSAMIDDTLGWVLYRKGLYTSAVKYLESANATEGTACRKFHLAMAYLKVGDRDRGLVALKAGLRLDSKLPEAKMAQELFK